MESTQNTPLDPPPARVNKVVTLSHKDETGAAFCDSGSLIKLHPIVLRTLMKLTKNLNDVPHKKIAEYSRNSHTV
jgi:hypothetical protein